MAQTPESTARTDVDAVSAAYPLTIGDRVEEVALERRLTPHGTLGTVVGSKKTAMGLLCFVVWDELLPEVANLRGGAGNDMHWPSGLRLVEHPQAPASGNDGCAADAREET
jgi:hypothetical protein